MRNARAYATELGCTREVAKHERSVRVARGDSRVRVLAVKLKNEKTGKKMRIRNTRILVLALVIRHRFICITSQQCRSALLTSFFDFLARYVNDIWLCRPPSRQITYISLISRANVESFCWCTCPSPTWSYIRPKKGSKVPTFLWIPPEQI